MSIRENNEKISKRSAEIMAAIEPFLKTKNDPALTLMALVDIGKAAYSKIQDALQREAMEDLMETIKDKIKQIHTEEETNKAVH